MYANSHGGLPCTDETREVQACNEQQCEPDVNCAWGEWTAWGACTKTCGGGQKQRDRGVVTAPR